MLVNTVVHPNNQLCECSKRLIGTFCGHRSEKLSFSLDKGDEILSFYTQRSTFHYFASSTICNGAYTDKILSSFSFWQTKKRLSCSRQFPCILYSSRLPFILRILPVPADEKQILSMVLQRCPILPCRNTSLGMILDLLLTYHFEISSIPVSNDHKNLLPQPTSKHFRKLQTCFNSSF